MVVPVFIAGGGHVLKDLPSLVEQAINRHPMLSIRIAHPVGESEAVLDAMACYIISSMQYDN
jgi:sirohydrochlorin cobaltochelatase